MSSITKSSDINYYNEFGTFIQQCVFAVFFVSEVNICPILRSNDKIFLVWALESLSNVCFAILFTVSCKWVNPSKMGSLLSEP